MDTSDTLRRLSKGRLSKVGTLTASVLVFAACAAPGDSTTADSPGAPAANVPTTTVAPIVSPAQLDAGSYPTAPRPPLGNAADPRTGAIADAQHLADFVVGPWEADEALVTPYLATYYLLDSSGALMQFAPESVAQRAERHGMVNGFASARQVTDKTVMMNAVFRFPDASAATAAAGDMNSGAAAQAVRGATPTSAVIPGHPEAAASTYPFTPHESDKEWTVIRSFAPHGPYVFMQLVQSVDGFDPAAALVQKAIDVQGPRIDEFRPAPADALAGVPLDPTGLLAKTLPLAGSAAPTKNAVYTRRGAVHFQSNPIASKTLFTDTGVTAVAMALTNVYEAKSPGLASMVVGSFSKEVTAQGAAPAEPVPGLPDSHCSERGKAFYCVASAGRYAVEVNAESLPQAHQQMAAQYILLTAG
ncbi:DUF7373 family lipoprotein [Mycolicibacterium frederiksbergense]|uniref:DUF7373 family lipoprotein n=1 Tax=Mycolicibacterium frederiksbergense TaxID=117567 RepID=UPI003999A065